MKRIFSLLFLTIMAYCLLLLFFFFHQNNLIYLPSFKKDFLSAPYQAIKLTTADKLSLTAWYIPPKPYQPTVFIMHGNAGLASARASIAAPYIKLGWGALLLEYRGYSQNPGKPSEKGLTLDANAGWNFLRQQNIPAPCIILYGESLGSAVAVNLANLHPHAGALILQSPFNNLVDVAKVHYPYLPAKWLLHDQYDTQTNISTIQMPVFIVHGNADTLIPLALSKKLYSAANSPKKMLIYPDIAHNDWDHQKVSQDLLPLLQQLSLCSAHVKY